MTVGDLMIQLSKFNKNALVVIDTSTDYESFDEVDRIVPGDFQHGMCGGHFEPIKGKVGNFNSVLLS